MTHSQKKRPEIRELLCYPKMLDLKEDFEAGTEDFLDERLLQTIKFPQNIKTLNENLPKPKYEARCKTTKQLPESSPGASEVKSIKSSAKLPAPSLRQITS